MKVVCSKENLVNAINTVQKAISSKTTLPILEGILLEAGDGFKMTATDLELGIEFFVEADVMDKGSIVLNSRVFGDIARKLPDSEVLIELNETNNLVLIECESSHFEISGLPASGYPALPEIEKNNAFKLSGMLLKEMVKQTIFAVSTDENRPILTGSLFEAKEGNLHVVSIDGFRLALRKEAVSSEYGDLNVVIPGKTLNEIIRIIESSEEEVTIYQTYNQILFEMSKCRIYSRLLEGEFLNFRNIIPKEFSMNIKVSTKQLLSGIERASLITRDDKKYPVRFFIQNDKLTITSNTEIGSSKEELSIESSGGELEIGFNPRYFIDALKEIEDEQIFIGFTSNVGPCVMKAIEEDKYAYMILPVRLRNE